MAAAAGDLAVLQQAARQDSNLDDHLIMELAAAGQLHVLQPPAISTS